MKDVGILRIRIQKEDEPFTPDRSCGGCTACCKTHEIRELEKPEGRWCAHCEIGKGCRIYAEKPKGCAAFECMWLQGVGKEEDRPDRSRVVMDSLDFGDGVLVLMLFEVSPGGFRTKLAQGKEEWALRRRIPVYRVTASGDRVIVIPMGAPDGEDVVELFRAKYPKIQVILRT